MSLEAVITAMREHHSFAVSPHVGPEGDAIGSALALALALRSMGKKAEVISRDPVPKALGFLPFDGLFFQRDQWTQPVESWVVVDCGDILRTGFHPADPSIIGRIINIDHHITNQRFGDINWVEEDAAASGVMIYDLLKEMAVPIDPSIATALYTTIASETGSYRYSNTSSKVFRMAADLADRGADVAGIARDLFERHTAGRIYLMGEVFSGMTLEEDGRVASMLVTQSMLARTETLPEETEDFVNYGRFIHGVEVSLVFREVAPRLFKISFRSQGNVDVSRLATDLGGGGHVYASGCLLPGDYASIRSRVLRLVRQSLPSPQPMTSCATES